jgi:hypothetical protein
MHRYLLETEAPGETRARELLVLNEEPLLAYLADLIEDDNAGALTPLISGIWRWEGGGRLTEFALTDGPEEVEEDHISQVFTVHATGHTHKPDCICGEVLSFRVKLRKP